MIDGGCIFLDSSDGIRYFLLLMLLLCSAFFSASETAFSSLNKIRLRKDAEEGDKKAKRTLAITEDFDRLLSTILVGNNVVNMASASIATVLATKIFGTGGAAVATAVMTVLVLIFGEILPKTLAKENSETVAKGVSGLIGLFLRVMRPVVWIFVKIKDVLVSLIHKAENKPSVTEEELKYIVESIEQEGVNYRPGNFNAPCGCIGIKCRLPHRRSCKNRIRSPLFPDSSLSRNGRQHYWRVTGAGFVKSSCSGWGNVLISFADGLCLCP